MKPLYYVLAIALALLVGCEDKKRTQELAKDRQKSQEQLKLQAIETIVIDVCKEDPENADMWRQSGLNLFTDPSSGQKKKVGKIPACESIKVDVLEKKVHDGVMFYRIRYESQDGWQTRRLLTDAGNPNAN